MRFAMTFRIAESSVGVLIGAGAGMDTFAAGKAQAASEAEDLAA